MAVTNVLVAGVGGQGVILSSEILALAALAHGLDVKQGEFHGVAQRGGAVFSHVRFGDRVHSPLAARGQVDYLLALEQLEALRYAHFLRSDGTVILNDHRVEPARTADLRPYPENAPDFLRDRGFNVVVVPATREAIEMGNYRAANVILLGALAAHLEIPLAVWNKTLDDRIPPQLLELNRRAFAAGLESVAGRVG